MISGDGRDFKRDGLVQLLARTLASTPMYPLRYAKVLIQLGHEPVAPQKRFNYMFQRYMYYYPGVFGYVRSIAKLEGWRGVYRGVGALFVEDFVALSAFTAVHPLVQSAVNKIPMPFYSSESGDVPDTDPSYSDSLPAILTRASRMFLSNLATHCIVQLAVQPFHVISVRTMAQFIGKETTYSGVYVSIKEIYRTEGVSGFYAGFIPSLLGHLCTNVIHSSLWLMFQIIVANISHEMGKLIMKTFVAAPLLAYIPNSYSYPFYLMSNIMAVNNSGLAVGVPPNVPIFTGWIDCYRYLKTTGNLYRGSVILFARFAYRDAPY